MLELAIKQSKNFFFLDRNGKARMFNGISKARHKVLTRSGALIRTIARRSMKKARRKRLTEISNDERMQFRARQEIAKREGRPAPKLPFAPSKPGEPPRVRAGQLKQFLYFAFDPASKSVVVGPAKLPSSSALPVPAILEFGGTSEGSRIAPRPYMRPALDVFKGQYTRLWQDSIA